VDRIERENLTEIRKLIKEGPIDGGILLICDGIYTGIRDMHLTPTEARTVGYYVIKELQKKMDTTFVMYDQIFPKM
jgi:hypothetical protein